MSGMAQGWGSMSSLLPFGLVLMEGTSSGLKLVLVGMFTSPTCKRLKENVSRLRVPYVLVVDSKMNNDITKVDPYKPHLIDWAFEMILKNHKYCMSLLSPKRDQDNDKSAIILHCSLSPI